MPSPDSTTNGTEAVLLPQNGNGHQHHYHDDDEPTSMLSTSENVEAYHHHESEEAEDRRKHGRDRPRKRKLYAEICKQMEFYFSDANITKNRNMREIIEKANAETGGLIDLSVFLEFTKMQRLTSNITHIQKALVRSEKLELSPDSLKAKRKVQFDPTKVKSDEAVEECTIYVENIPRDAEHEWLEKIFQAFGSVAYISLPKSKRGHHKGFAFVEFDDVDAARRCLEVYGEEGACLPNDLNPAELRSIQSFKEEQEETVPTQSSKIANVVPDEGNTSKAQKRKAGEALPLDGDSKAKKERRDSSSSEVEEEEKVTTTDNIALMNTVKQEQVALSSSKKSKKKRKKNKSKKTIEARLESESIVLKVLPKKTWRQLRNRYLNLQRNNMTKLKKQLKHEQMRAQHFKNFYQPPQQSRHKNIPSASDAANQKPTYKLDYIMKITLKKPSESDDQLKHKITVELAEQDEDEAAVSGFIKFVDINDSIAYVRINSDASFSSRADNLLEKANEAFGRNSARFLSDKEVEEYKEKVQAGLRQRLREQPRKNVRGKDRLMKAATKSTHIKFESDSEAEELEESKSTDPALTT